VKISLKSFHLFLSVVLFTVGLTACNLNAPVPPNQEPGLSEGLQTSPPTTLSLTETPTRESANLQTPTSPSSPTLAQATSTPLPEPSPTPLALRNIPIEGGDPDNKFFAELVFPNEQVFTSRLWFRVYAHKPLESKVDGEGIEQVDFTIQNSAGEVVHSRTEKMAGYCAFGGGEPDCVIWDFREHQYQWPDGGKILSGTYTLNVQVQSTDSAFMFGDATFTIQVP
jgi:hypothetical protein